MDTTVPKIERATISDDAIRAAVAECGQFKAAAVRLGLSYVALYRRASRMGLRGKWSWNEATFTSNALAERQEIRRLVYEKFGNKCGRCGFTDPRAFNIDHVHNDGAQERRASRKDTEYWRRILLDARGAVSAPLRQLQHHQRA